MMGQLPAERVTPGSVFDKVGVDYAGPIYTKIGAVRRPKIVKSYIAVFVSLSVKAVHLEAVSDLSADAFLACLRRFTARQGKPVLIWSDHGTNFTGTAHLLSELSVSKAGYKIKLQLYLVGCHVHVKRCYQAQHNVHVNRNSWL